MQAILLQLINEYYTRLRNDQYRHQVCPHFHNLKRVAPNLGLVLYCRVCGEMKVAIAFSACNHCGDWCICGGCNGKEIDETYVRFTKERVMNAIQDVMQSTQRYQQATLTDTEVRDLKTLVVHACICPNVTADAYRRFVGYVFMLGERHGRLLEAQAFLQMLATEKAESLQRWDDQLARRAAGGLLDSAEKERVATEKHHEILQELLSKAQEMLGSSSSSSSTVSSTAPVSA